MLTASCSSSYEPLSISLRAPEAEPPAPPTAPPAGSPRRSEGHPDPPTESRSCSQGSPSPASPDPRACNWKKFKFIVLSSQTARAGSSAGESPGRPCPAARPPSGDEASSSSSEEGPAPGLHSRSGLRDSQELQRLACSRGRASEWRGRLPGSGFGDAAHLGELAKSQGGRGLSSGLALSEARA